jgi:hypothetical protein
VFRRLSTRTSLQVRSFRAQLLNSKTRGFTTFLLPYLDCSQFFAAFVVATNDTRFILREITHGQTFVVPASFSLIVNISDLSRLNSTLLFDSFFKNVMDSLLDAFKHVVSARVAFALSGESLYRMHPNIGQIVFTSSAFLVAFNCSTSPSFDVWSSLAISLFHSKSMSPAIKNLISLQTLQARSSWFCAWVLRFHSFCFGGCRRFCELLNYYIFVVVSICFLFLLSFDSTAHPAQSPPCIKFH